MIGRHVSARAAQFGTALWLAVFTASLTEVAPVAAHEFKLGSLLVVHPWARATPPGATVAAGYLKIENGGTGDDRLVSAVSEISEGAELHETAVADGTATMRPVTEGLVIPAGGSVDLSPGSYHLMFTGLARPLKEGESFAATLTFEKAGALDVTFDVAPIGAPEPPEHAHE